MDPMGDLVNTVDSSEIRHQLRLVVNISLFAGFQKHLRWLFGISAINNTDQGPLNGLL